MNSAPRRMDREDELADMRLHAHMLAASLPDAVVAARALAAHVAHGIHGRRRAGMGDQFWQYRMHQSGEPRALIDWRRSARDRHLYVREREWEGAHDIWLWVDRSLTMGFSSAHSWPTKEQRALVLALALADMLVRGGERVGLMGLRGARAPRHIIDDFAACWQSQTQAQREAPIPPLEAGRGPHAHYVLLSDFLASFDEVARSIAALAGQGARGVLLMVNDPCEDDFPFEGHVHLHDMNGQHFVRFSDAGAMRADYHARFADHCAQLRDLCALYGWRLMRHRTDHAPAPVLLALHMQLGDEGAGASAPLSCRADQMR